jgi:hypothetical protein
MMPGLSPLALDFTARASALADNLLYRISRMAQPAQVAPANAAKIAASAHSSDSSLREQVLGHVFLGQLLTFMWRNGARDIEVLKSEVDPRRVRCGARVQQRHPARPAEVDVSTRLLRKPGGCILWLEFDRQILAIERFYWFGGPPGIPLPDLGARISRHSRGNAEGEKNERPIHRVLTRGRFEALADIGEVAEKLFG